MLLDHGSPRTAPRLGLRFDVCLQILLHHPGMGERGRTAGSLTQSKQTSCFNLWFGAAVSSFVWWWFRSQCFWAPQMCLKQQVQAHLHPDCQEGPSGNPPFLLRCFLFFNLYKNILQVLPCEPNITVVSGQPVLKHVQSRPWTAGGTGKTKQLFAMFFFFLGSSTEKLCRHNKNRCCY